ncbi:3-methyl-2-oxobutanoate hydroxymethyltransferase [Dehalobacter sp. DCM]|uniref:3-methyl-2-oxobutanoate hydroxymethyltransferase n=1 Tax=Dehalobacter sp. DCM TaxID=2907827 RepID=UPI003081C9E8|nr:3-methyl-2-oxobutanoate hydroxymethyltransferase [Dehalobacter sp. DCM]
MSKKLSHDFKKMAALGEKITMLTAYDYPTAHILEKAGIDVILVGDSLGMVVLGYESTVPVTMEDMIHHTKAVRRGAPNTFIIADMPYLSYATQADALQNAKRLIQEAGADAVKLEGGDEYSSIVRFLTQAGVSVVGHIGLTPQTAAQLGGYKVQGQDIGSATKILRDAGILTEAGIMMLTLEAVPAELAKRITETISVPTIGIGAGVVCSGQVLVVHDLLGVYDRFVPSFVKQYENLEPRILEAVMRYCSEVKTSTFPAQEHSFKLHDDVKQKLF